MSTQDYTIWQRFRRVLPSTTRGLYFNVRLGSGRDLPDDTSDHWRDRWRTLTAKRADVVIEQPDGWLLVELRENAQLNAIGRLLGYRKLWTDEPPDARPLSLLLVTNVLDPDVRDLAADHGIGYLIA